MKVVAAGGHELNLVTTGEVAKMFSVDPKTVARWSKTGRFTEYRTPGGHRRYDMTEVLAFLQPKVPALAEAEG